MPRRRQEGCAGAPMQKPCRDDESRRVPDPLLRRLLSVFRFVSFRSDQDWRARVGLSRPVATSTFSWTIPEKAMRRRTNPKPRLSFGRALGVGLGSLPTALGWMVGWCWIDEESGMAKRRRHATLTLSSCRRKAFFPTAARAEKPRR